MITSARIAELRRPMHADGFDMDKAVECTDFRAVKVGDRYVSEELTWCEFVELLDLAERQLQARGAIASTTVAA